MPHAKYTCHKPIYHPATPLTEPTPRYCTRIKPSKPCNADAKGLCRQQHFQTSRLRQACCRILVLTHTHPTFTVAGASERLQRLQLLMPHGHLRIVIVFCSPHTHASHNAHTPCSHQSHNRIQLDQGCLAPGWHAVVPTNSAAAPGGPGSCCCRAVCPHDIRDARHTVRTQQVLKQHLAALTAAAVAALHSHRCSPAVAAPGRYSCAAQQ
jgi:hypothetical protein